MKICMIGPTYPFKGGISHHTTLLYRHLRQKHDVSFFAFSRSYPAWLFPGDSSIDGSDVAIRENGVHYSIDYLNPKSWWDVSAQICSMNPQLVIFPWWVIFWTPVYLFMIRRIRKRTTAKILFVCHNVVPHDDSLMDKWCTRTVLRDGDHCFVHSVQEQEKLKILLPDISSSSIRLPTLDVFNFNRLSKEEARKRLRIEGRWILFFGFVRPYKGLRYLIEAMPIVLREVDVNLMIVGEFWEPCERFKRLAVQLGVDEKVMFHDRYVPNEEVEVYFRACDIVIAPYLSVTTSAIAQLAYGLGKGIIASDIGTFSEIVEPGRTGFLINPSNSTSLASGILKFYRENKEEEFAENVQKATSRFSWDTMVNAIESVVGNVDSLGAES